MHANDLGEACVFALVHWYPTSEAPPFLNVGTGKDLSIKSLAEEVAKSTGFRGQILWETTKPDGTPKKLLDVTRMSRLGWRAKISLVEGLKSTFNDYDEVLNKEFIRL